MNSDVIIIITATVPPIIIDARLLSIIELLDETSDKTLCNKAALMLCWKHLAEGSFEELLHVLALCKNGEERFDLKNIHKDERCIHDSLVLGLATKLVNQRSQNLLLFLSNLCRDFILKVRFNNMEDTVDHFGNAT